MSVFDLCGRSDAWKADVQRGSKEGSVGNRKRSLWLSRSAVVLDSSGLMLGLPERNLILKQIIFIVRLVELDNARSLRKLCL